jgi:hypothetical protein
MRTIGRSGVSDDWQDYVFTYDPMPVDLTDDASAKWWEDAVRRLDAGERLNVIDRNGLVVGYAEGSVTHERQAVRLALKWHIDAETESDYLHIQVPPVA